MRESSGWSTIPPRPADVIIVLGDDNYAGDRAFHAAELYRSGVAPVVVASGRMLRANVSVADLIEHDLESFGIPASAVVKFSHRASNTKQEAEAASGLIARSGWKRILIVTSNYHARRARFIFDRVLPSGLSLRVSGARDSEFNPSDWWETRTGQKLFLDELLGYAAARWELRGKPAGGGAARLRREFSADHCAKMLLNRYVHRTILTVSDWKHTRFTGSAPRLYSSYFTVLSGLL